MLAVHGEVYLLLPEFQSSESGLPLAFRIPHKNRFGCGSTLWSGQQAKGIESAMGKGEWVNGRDSALWVGASAGPVARHMLWLRLLSLCL